MAVYVFSNDGKHEGSGTICEVTQGGFAALCKQAAAIMQQPVRRVFALVKARDHAGNATGKMDGYEISPGAGTSHLPITYGMEVVVSAGEDFIPSDKRSADLLEKLGMTSSPHPREDEEPERPHFYYDIDGHLHFGKEQAGDEEEEDYEEYEEEEEVVEETAAEADE